MVNTAEIRALLITPDALLITTFTSACRELGIDAHESAATNGVPEELGKTKYEAVLIDFDLVPETLPILAGVRASRVNRNALVFAVATGTAHRHEALRRGATCVFDRPLDANEIRRALYAAYDLMARESRRYFRCTVELPVLVGQAKEDLLRCTTINISSYGMAVKTASSFCMGEMLQVTLFLQGAGQAVRANGTVAWDDKHGKTGINFQCCVPEDQGVLDEWLNTRFYELLVPRHAIW